jgi:hypothetical protein
LDYNAVPDTLTVVPSMHTDIIEMEEIEEIWVLNKNNTNFIATQRNCTF